MDLTSLLQSVCLYAYRNLVSVEVRKCLQSMRALFEFSDSGIVVALMRYMMRYISEILTSYIDKYRAEYLNGAYFAFHIKIVPFKVTI